MTAYLIQAARRFRSAALRAMPGLIALVCVASAASAAAGEKAVMRCGWFDNPTPGNAWLNDRDGQWIIGVQGGHQADGDWPEFSRKQWVHTNGGSYGYGCACMRVAVEPGTHNVAVILSASARPLAQCRQDSKLKKPAP